MEQQAQQAQYTKRWAADQPGCLIIMLDQSGSMEDPMGSGLIGAGTRKADAAAMVVNNMLKEVVSRSTQGTDVRPRVDLSVIGYGGPNQTVHNALGGALAGQDTAPISMVAANPMRIENRVDQEFNAETGTMIQIPTDVPIWVEPVAAGGTPMCAALDMAYYVAYNWVMAHPDNFPPIIVNISDGAATDGDPVVSAQQFSQLYTNDGYCLLFNCHLSSTPGYQVKYPYDMSQVPPDPLAQQLFQMSSILPDPMLSFANANYGMNLYQGSRGFIFGADIKDLTQFVAIASLPKADR